MKKNRTAIDKLITYFLLCIFSFVAIMPFIWMLSSSLKTNLTMFSFPIEWIPRDPQWNNYREVWTEIDFSKAFLNTSVLAIGATVGGIITSCFAAYAFSKLDFPGRNFLFLMYLSVMMIPWQSIMVPQFIIMKNLSLMNKISGLIILHSFNAFNVFMLRQFFSGIPAELSEAAKLEGAGHTRILISVMVPIAKPAISSAMILAFLAEWNDYLGPLIYLSDESKFTIQLALKTFQSQFSMDYVVVFAGTACSIVPILILYILFQKNLTEGIALSGMK